jgi:KUP system potassium uptake protein
MRGPNRGDVSGSLLQRIMAKNDIAVSGIVKSMGLVFGDIGTSPIYTLGAIFLLTTATPSNIMGILSLIVWTLIILITVEYTFLAMYIGKKGEGGTIVLREILTPRLKSGRSVAVVLLLTIIGISLFIGDGVITPAISILSAVEGIQLIPGFEATEQGTIILIAAIIAIMLFAFQRTGSEKVAWTFGPLMVIWFVSLAVSGIVSIIHTPTVFLAINPYYAITYLLENGISGFIVLSAVILCATGGEALYADMGHLGRAPIIRAWYLVFIALMLNYLGQGAFLMQNPESHFVLFEMVFAQSSLVYIPFLILSIAATIIASQAMISGVFSIVYQGIVTHIMPMLKIDYMSAQLRSQIYIDSVNWLLLFSVLLIMFEFKASTNLASAYGLAVTGDMMITGILITTIFFLRKDFSKALIGIGVIFVDIGFFIAALHKIPFGAYWSVVIALIPFGIIMIYLSGQKKLFNALRPMDVDHFLEKYNHLYQTLPKIKGTALYFARDIRKLPPYIPLTMFTNNIIYEDNVIISIRILDNPFGVIGGFKENLTTGLRVFEIQMGYMEVVDIVKMLRDAGIDEKTIFYGLEDIVTNNVIWKIFSAIKRLTPSFVQFYKLPADKIHGVVTRVEM